MAAEVGGKGGGKPDLAQAGGSEPGKIDAALEKLYELSRRILLLDRRQTVGPQIVSVIREIFGTESVALFDARLARMDATGSRANDLEQLARSAYFQDGTLEGADAHTWAHVLRLGSRPAGGIALRGPEVGRLTIVSIASLAAIALGTSRSLIERAADVTLKERRKLILVPRETPRSLVHLRNLTAVTEAGAVVIPAAPGFYHRPTSIAQLVDFIVQRIVDQLDLDISIAPRWEG